MPKDYSKYTISVTGDPNFSSFFQSLPSNNEIRKKLDRMLERLKVQPDEGDQIKKSLWPEDYKAMGLRCLFRYEIDDSMRATYTIRSAGPLDLEVAVIEFFPTHKDYERRFRY